MKCSTIMYKISRSKLMKQLIKEAGNPDNYVNVYQQLIDLFTSYKHKRYNEETIKKILDLYIEKKGLEKVEDKLEEIQKTKEVREDNYVVLELKQDINELIEKQQNINRKMLDLQELVIKKLEDNKNIHNRLMNVKNNHRRIRHKT